MGSHFMGKVMRDFCQALGIDQKASPAYCQHIQGLTEKFNGTLVRGISHYVNEHPSNWAKYVQHVTFAYNCTKNASTGYSPYYLTFGHEPQTPLDTIYIRPDMDSDILNNLKIIQEVRSRIPEILQKAQHSQKKYHDVRRQPLELKPGDEVMIHYPKPPNDSRGKFTPSFYGPYTIIEKLNEVTYVVQTMKYGRPTHEHIHVSRMKLFHR